MDRRLYTVQDRLAEHCAQTLKTVQGSVSAVTSYFQKEVPVRHESDHESLFQRAFAAQYNGKKMKKLEKDYTVIRKDEQEEQMEIRRLRNENRLLRQRVENLEKESATLANRLIEGQIMNAQHAEESYQLKRENCSLKHQIDETASLSTQPPVTSSSSSNPRSSSDFLVTTNDNNEVEILRETVNRLSTEIRRLQSTPNAELASLQDELTQVKMRDAEAQVNLSELRQRLSDLNHEWQSHERTCQTTRETIDDPNADAYDLIAHELVSLKMREAQLDCDTKFLSQKLMDVETQKQVLYNQIKRQDEESQRMRLELEQGRIRENDLRLQYNELRNRVCDGQLRQKEDSMMLRIREAESTQTIGDLRQKIAELEIQNQEFITRDQISDDKDLQDKLVDLQDEVMRLRSFQTFHRRPSLSADHARLDYEESEDESMPSSSPTHPHKHHLSSSSGIYPTNSIKDSTDSLHRSTASLSHSAANLQTSYPTASTHRSSSQSSS